MKQKQSSVLTLLGSTFGNIIEFYDYLIYAYLAPILTGIMFPKYPKEHSVILIMQLLALSYLARPVGSLIFGPIGDRFGRKKALIISTLLIGVSTISIGLAPSFPQVKSSLIACFIISLRLLQGVSVGGEYMTTSIYITEFAPSSKRGLWGSFINFSGHMGVILASFALLTLSMIYSEEDINSYAWRFPFLFGFLSLIAALYIRTKLKESPVFEYNASHKQIIKKPILKSFKSYKKGMFILFVLVAFQAVGFYATSLYLNLWAVTYHNISLSTTAISSIIAAHVTIASGFFGGYLSDKIGRKPVIIIGALGVVLLSWPTMVFMTFAGGSDTIAIRYMVGQSVLQLLMGIFNGAVPALFTELFPAKLRCTPVLLSFNLATALFGATSPLVSLWLVKMTGIAAFPSLYLTFFGIGAIICTAYGIKETYHCHIDHREEMQHE